MDLKDIASISGKSGLYLVLKPTRTGVILETIDENRTKLIASASTRVSLLKEISIYTVGTENSVPLEKVFEKTFSAYNHNLPVNSKSSPEELNSFLEKILPEFDKEKVYYSDIKKLVTWYQSILTYLPERFKIPPVEEEANISSSTKEEDSSNQGEEQEKIKAEK